MLLLLFFAFSWWSNRRETQHLPLPKGRRSVARWQNLQLLAAAVTFHNTQVGLKWESSAGGRGTVLELICGWTWPSWDCVFCDKCQIWCRWMSLTNMLWDANYLSHCWMGAERQMVLRSLWHLKPLYVILRRQFYFSPPFSWLFQHIGCCFQMVAKCSRM